MLNASAVLSEGKIYVCLLRHEKKDGGFLSVLASSSSSFCED